MGFLAVKTDKKPQNENVDCCVCVGCKRFVETREVDV